MIQFKSIKGMHDILPHDSPYWSLLENTVRDVVSRYGYREIRTPVLESTSLFKRTVGEVTDIVEKEMYSFDDRNADSVTLRPEGTASCTRAIVEHNLLYGQTQRLWYLGPMFRYEQPQKGRYRQFYQLGVEAYGIPGPLVDMEIILLCRRLWHELGLLDRVRLEINTLGSSAVRSDYRDRLVSYLGAHQHQLDADSQRRLTNNPLRILDSKNPEMAELIKAAPKLLDHLDMESQQHFEQFCLLLKQADVPYTVNPNLVRGLDYYSHTVFEWVTDELGAQGTVCAGGRYDNLVEILGGKPAPAVGFAAGLERLVLLLRKVQECCTKLDVYMVCVGDDTVSQALLLAEKLRHAVPTLSVIVHLTGGSFKSQFKKADKSGAKWALVIGEQEIVTGQYTLKNLRNNEPQQTLNLGTLVTYLRENV